MYAMLIPYVNRCPLPIPCLWIPSSHCAKASSTEPVENFGVRICESRHTALWRVGIVYPSHNILKLSKPFILMSRRSVELASPVHNVIKTFCNADAILVPLCICNKIVGDVYRHLHVHAVRHVDLRLALPCEGFTRSF